MRTYNTINTRIVLEDEFEKMRQKHTPSMISISVWAIDGVPCCGRVYKFPDNDFVFVKTCQLDK